MYIVFLYILLLFGELMLMYIVRVNVYGLSMYLLGVLIDVERLYTLTDGSTLSNIRQ